MGKCSIDLMGKWPSDLDIIYIIKDLPAQTITRDKLEDIFEGAFGAWRVGASLPFQLRKAKNGEEHNLLISWVDQLKVGGDGIIGYADYPRTDGKPSCILFNKDLEWKTGNPYYRIGTFALHELGHTIGLGHGAKKRDMMCSCIDGEWEREYLSDCDKESASAIYHPRLLTRMSRFLESFVDWWTGKRISYTVTYRGKQGESINFQGDGAVEFLEKHYHHQ